MVGAALDGDRFVSTGRLPRDDRVAAALSACHRDLAPVSEGAVSEVYPALARADPQHFGIAVMGVDGHEAAVGDVDVGFALMSVAKPFVFALACERHGVERVVRHLGVNATNRPFDSLAAVEEGPGGRTNPMVNAGAIACTELLGTGDGAWDELAAGLSAFAGRDLDLDQDVLASATATNLRNRAIGQLLHAAGLVREPEVAVDLYTRQSCLRVTARDLAAMGATLADAGVNPLTGRRVVSADTASRTLAVMATAGMYERSGEWLVHVGLPAKSGISGGIVTAAPGKGGLGTYSPPLGPLATVEPADVKALALPLVLAFVFGVAGIAGFSALVGKLLGYSVPMSVAIGLTSLYGFPGTMILSQEAARGAGESPEEVAAIEGSILPKMIVAGFSTVTITSVVVTSILAGRIGG